MQTYPHTSPRTMSPSRTSQTSRTNLTRVVPLLVRGQLFLVRDNNSSRPPSPTCCTHFSRNQLLFLDFLFGTTIPAVGSGPTLQSCPRPCPGRAGRPGQSWTPGTMSRAKYAKLFSERVRTFGQADTPCDPYCMNAAPSSKRLALLERVLSLSLSLSPVEEEARAGSS